LMVRYSYSVYLFSLIYNILDGEIQL